jgi:hypothetical protein
LFPGNVNQSFINTPESSIKLTSKGTWSYISKTSIHWKVLQGSGRTPGTEHVILGLSISQDFQPGQKGQMVLEKRKHCHSFFSHGSLHIQKWMQN